MGEPDGASVSVGSSWIVLDPILGEIDRKLAKLNELLEQLLTIQRHAALGEEAPSEPTTYRWVCDNCGRWILTAGVSPKACPACGIGQLYCYKGGPGGEG